MIARIEPGRLCGSVMAPPSKSYAQRLLIGAALSGGKSVISGISESEDMGAALDCIKSLGAEAFREGGSVVITGRKAPDPGPVQDVLPEGGAVARPGGPESVSDNYVIFPCRESGNTLRFFIPISLCFFDKVCFTGSGRLMERGISVYEELFASRGIAVKRGKGPACAVGVSYEGDKVSEGNEEAVYIDGSLTCGEYELRGDISSQFVTGLLFSLPLLTGDSRLKVLPPVESRAYIDITIDVLRSFGIEIKEEEENSFYIKGGQRYLNRDAQVEGDWSNAAFLYAFNSLGHKLMIGGLNSGSIQGDRRCVKLFEELDEESPGIDISDCPDLGPVLFAVAAAKNGGFFTGTRRLRLKESDRVAAMAAELKKFGAETEIGENSVTVKGTKLSRPKQMLYGHNDHRIVMALSVLLTLTGGEIEGVQAVRKTWPDFFEEMEKLSMKVQLINET
ncbi:MAG: 3-phosphoshikimate 1-carboxyvinyltransferase [Lachnospiraceae bacterium]|nr:3-phosphoshikimate 1-carboxyvinyltransferase [Lachnospiraceae bacterium]